MNNLKLLQNSIRKNCLNNNYFKPLNFNYNSENFYFINFNITANFVLNFNDNILFIKSIYDKSSEVINTLNNLVITNLKGVNSQSILEKNLFFREIKNLSVDLNRKEGILKNTLERYYNQKRILEKNNKNLENAKLKNLKYENIVKIEMEIKIATKQISEIQAALSLAADDYKENRINFTEKSLKIYLNFMKNIVREYEVLRALLLSFFEFFIEVVNSSIPSNINNNTLIEENNNNYQFNLINNIFNEFISEYYENSDKLKIVNFKENSNINNNINNILEENFNNEEKYETIDGTNEELFFIPENKFNGYLNKNNFFLSPVGDQIIESNIKIQKIIFDNSFYYKINEQENPLLNNNKEICNIKSEKDPEANNIIKYSIEEISRSENYIDCDYLIKNNEFLKIKDENFINDLSNMQNYIKRAINKIRGFLETKLNFIKKNNSLMNNYKVVSNQVKNAFSEFELQSKKLRKNKIHYFFKCFNPKEEDLYAIDQNESINLNLIFIKIFNIANKFTNDLSNYTNIFSLSINENIGIIALEDKKHKLNMKFINDRFNYLIIKSENLLKSFFNEILILKKEKINNRSLFNLKLKKIAENFIVRKVLLIDDIKTAFEIYDKLLRKITEKITYFNKEYNSLKSNYIYSLKNNCSIFMNLLEKSVNELSNSYNIEDEIKNIPKLKEKINNEIIELMIFNKDYYIDIEHDKKCNHHINKDIHTKLNQDKNQQNEIGLKNPNNLLNEKPIEIEKDAGSKILDFNLNKDIIEDKNKNFINLDKNIFGEDNKIKNSYFQKIKNFILKRSDNRGKKKNNKNTCSGEIIKDIEDIISDIQTKEKTYENYSIINQGYLRKEEAHWLNRLLETFFQKWKQNDFFKKWFKRLLFRIWNKKRPQNLDTIWIDDVQVFNLNFHISYLINS